MFIYLTFFMVSIFFTYLSYRSNNRINRVLCGILALLPLIILGGCRDVTVGADTQAYPVDALFLIENSSSLNEIITGSAILEPAYLILSYIGYFLFGQNLNAILIATQAIILIFAYMAVFRLRKYCPPYMAWAIYLFLFFNMTMNAMRQNIAISIVFFATTFLLEKRLKTFLFLSLLALMFHKSAVCSVILVPILYIDDVKINKWIILVSLSMLLFYSVFLRNLLSFDFFSKYEQYAENGEWEGRFSYSEFLYRFVFLSALWFWTPKKWKNGFYYNVLTVFVCEFFINLLQIWSRYIGRVGLYLHILYIVFIPYYVFYTRGKPRKIIHQTVIFMVVFFYWLYVWMLKDAGFTSEYSSKILGIG